jgi:hypothetical protein
MWKVVSIPDNLIRVSENLAICLDKFHADYRWIFIHQAALGWNKRCQILETEVVQWERYINDQKKEA